MPNADNAQLYYEATQILAPMGPLADSGDAKFFESQAPLWSAKSGFSPDIKPDGVISGFQISPNAANDKIDVAAGTLYQAGTKRTVAAASGQTLTRGTTTPFIKFSITIDDSQAVTVVDGTGHATAHSDVRGEAGGPPFIPVGSVEIGQVWLTSQAAALVSLSEIKQVQGTHQERWDYPTWNEKRMNVANGVAGNAGIDFLAPLPLTHTGGKPKGVYASYYTPDFAEVPDATDFKPAETTHSTTSKQVYGNTIGSSSSTLGQSTFTCFVKDGVTDAILKEKNENIFFKFKPDRLNPSYLLQQGKFGVSRSFPSGDSISIAATVSAEEAAVEVY